MARQGLAAAVDSSSSSAGGDVVRNKRHPASEEDTEQSASAVREIRLKWSDKIETTGGETEGLKNYRKDGILMKDKMNMNLMDEKRDKRFLDPDSVIQGGVVDGLGGLEGLEGLEGAEEGSGEQEEEEASGPQDEDPHKEGQQFCVDISEYLDLKWVLKDAEECHVTFNR